MKKATFFATLVLFIFSLRSQILLNGATNVCPAGTWKLVWHDEFNGSVIDNTKWHTFWPDWPCYCDGSLNSRTFNGAPNAPQGTIYEDNNISVSNGIAKIKIENESATWKGVTTNFTGGVLHSKINFYYGRFEARVKIPNGKGFWPAFWLFGGSGNGSGTEIDMFEFFGNSRTVHHQGVINWINTMVSPQQLEMWDGAYTSNQDMSLAFHTYVAEWEPYFITFYTDGIQKARFPRLDNVLGQSINACTPAAGYYYDNVAFPTYNYYTNLILSVSADWENNTARNPDASTPFPGVMEIDFVRIYQKTPQPGFTDLCDGTITGNITICSVGQYNYSLSSPAGRLATSWTVSPNLQIVSFTGSSVTVQALSSNTNGSAWIKSNLSAYTPCTQNNITKNIWVGKPNQPATTISTEMCMSGFDIEACCNNLSSPVFAWTVSGASVQGINSGACSSILYNTPSYNFSKPYIVTASNQCGSITKSGTVVGPGCNGMYRIAVTPNPASDEITIRISDDIFIKGGTIQIVSNERGFVKEIILENNNISENIRNLQDGLYYIVYPQENEEYISEAFIIKH